MTLPPAPKPVSVIAVVLAGVLLAAVVVVRRTLPPSRMLNNPRLDELRATDAQLVRMIVGNLVDNALKYAAPGSPIKVTATAGIRRKRKGIAIEVVNSIGTADAPDPKRVFGKYYRGERARGKTGSGLGLHIAAGFASKLGGSIRYQPSDTEVRFHLWIPG